MIQFYYTILPTSLILVILKSSGRLISNQISFGLGFLVDPIPIPILARMFGLKFCVQNTQEIKKPK